MSNAQIIYDKLRRAGMTEAGALGMLGNLQAESGCESCRVQGDYQSGFAASKDYARRIDDGELSLNRAAEDGRGWGLAQWTYPARKRAVLTFCRGLGKSVGDLDAQVEFLIREFRSDYPGLWNYLCSTDDVYGATERVCKEFERPAVNNVAARYEFAEKLRSDVEGKDKPSEYWPPRMICVGMDGADVEVMQAVLKARGYTLMDTPGVFGNSTETALKAFQEDHNLDADGICGPKSWTKLLERGGAL